MCRVKMRGIMRAVRFFIYLFSLLFFTALLFGYFGWIHPAFDSLSAFRFHFACLTLGTSIALFSIRARLGGGSLAVAALVSLYYVLASPYESAHEPRAGATYRLLQVNVRFDNATPKQLLQIIARTRPDVITAQEVTPRWQAELTTIASAYPYQLFCEAQDKVGVVAILSKRPFVDAPSNHCSQGAAIAIQSVDFGGQIIQVASLHLYWPWPLQQPQQVQDMKPIFATMKSADAPVLIAGDLNATRWSYTAQVIADVTGAMSIAYHGGSWLAYEFPQSWIKWLGLPIDNVFSSKLSIKSINTQANFGSDHLPLLIEFQIPARSQDNAFEPLNG